MNETTTYEEYLKATLVVQTTLEGGTENQTKVAEHK